METEFCVDAKGALTLIGAMVAGGGVYWLSRQAVPQADPKQSEIQLANLRRILEHCDQSTAMPFYELANDLATDADISQHTPKPGYPQFISYIDREDFDAQVIKALPLHLDDFAEAPRPLVCPRDAICEIDVSRLVYGHPGCWGAMRAEVRYGPLPSTIFHQEDGPKRNMLSRLLTPANRAPRAKYWLLLTMKDAGKNISSMTEQIQMQHILDQNDDSYETKALVAPFILDQVLSLMIKLSYLEEKIELEVCAPVVAVEHL